MKKGKFYHIFLISLINFIMIYGGALLAQPMISNSSDVPGIGEIASELSGDPTTWTMRFFYGACYLIGGVLMWKGYEQYKAHKGLAQYVPLYDCIFKVVLGLIAICIPLAHYIFKP